MREIFSDRNFGERVRHAGRQAPPATGKTCILRMCARRGVCCFNCGDTPARSKKKRKVKK